MLYHVDHAEIPGQQVLGQLHPDLFIAPALRDAIESVLHIFAELGKCPAPILRHIVEHHKGGVILKGLQVLLHQKGVDHLCLPHVHDDVAVLPVHLEGL